jgi:hypothetical protein
MKKITNKYYRNEKSTEAVEIDYNLLRHDYYSKQGMRRMLLGSYLDRIQEFLLRKGWVKINVTTFTKLKDGYDNQGVHIS